MEQRLIDANELKKRAYPFPCSIGREYAVSLRQINDTATIDHIHAAGACYCRECRYYKAGDKTLGDCMRFKENVYCIRIDDFCSYGERRESEDKNG